MRLVKIGLASCEREHHGGRVPRQHRPRARAARRRWPPTTSRSASSPSSSSAATRPRTSSSGGASSTRSGASSSASRGRPRQLPTVLRARRHGRARGPALQLRGAGRRRARSAASCPKEKLPTYNVFYEGRTFARGCPGHGRACTRRAASAISLPLRLRHARARGLRGPLDRPTARCAAAPTRAPSWSCNVSASPFRVGVVETRARDDRHPRGRQPVHLAYANLVGAQRRAHLRRRRLRRPERQAWCSRRRASRRASTRRRSTSTAPRGCAPRTPPGATDQRGVGRRRSAPVPTIDVPASRSRDQRDELHLPGAAAPELLPARAETPRAAPRDALLRGPPRRARARASATTSRRTAPSRRIGVALSGGRDSLLTLLIAHRYAQRGAARRPGLAPARVLHADALLVGGDARRPRETICARARRAAPVVSHRRGVRARARGGEKHAQPGEALTPDHRQNIQARIRGAAHVELVRTPPAGSSCRRAT